MTAWNIIHLTVSYTCIILNFKVNQTKNTTSLLRDLFKVTTDSGTGSTSWRLAPNSSKRGLTMKCTTWKGSRKYSVHDFQKCASTKENFSVVNWRTSQWLLNPSWRNEAGLFAVHLDMKYDSSPLERGIRSYDILFDLRKYF